MTGTTIAATGTIGILITLASENPVTITPKGTIITTGYYALEDTVVPGNSDQILNQGKLSGQSGIIVSGASATVTDLGSIAGTNAYGVDALENASVEVGNIDNTTASLAGLEYGAAFGGATTAASNVTNFATIVGGTAIEDLNAGQLNVTNEATSAQIRATSGDAVLSNGALDLTNNGSIAGAIQANGGGTVLNGNLSALLVPVVTSASITGNIGMSGTKDVLLNFGKVIGGAFLNAGTILNGSSFDITALLSNANNYGASISQPGTVINYGTIAGRAAGVALGDGGTVTNGSTSDTVALISGGVGIAGSSANAVYNYATVTGGVRTPSRPGRAPGGERRVRLGRDRRADPHPRLLYALGHGDLPRRRAGDCPQARSTLPAGERHLDRPAGRRKGQARTASGRSAFGRRAPAGLR
jgi:hypothetical protein